MGWKAFVASIVGSLAWPSVVTLLLFLLRGQIASLAQRLEELTLPGGAKAKFRGQLDLARQQAEETGLESGPAVPLTADDPYVDLANRYPAAAVLQSFKEVEAAILRYNERFTTAKRHIP